MRCLRSQCQICVGNFCFSGRFSEVPGILGTLLLIHQTCRSRFAPFVQSAPRTQPEYTRISARTLRNYSKGIRDEA
jgi:hypothetical protein